MPDPNDFTCDKCGCDLFTVRINERYTQITCKNCKQEYTQWSEEQLRNFVRKVKICLTK